MLQAISTALCQWITAVFLMAPCGPMCIVPDGSSQASYWAPLAISWAEHVASHTHSQCWLQELFASDQQRGEKHAIKLAVGSKSFGWLLQIAFSESLDPPLVLFFPNVWRVFAFFRSIFGPSFGSQKRSQKLALKSGINRILNKAANLRPSLGSKNGPRNGPVICTLFGFLCVFFVQCFELVVRQQHTCSGPNLLGPLATKQLFSSTWMKPE